MIQRFAADNLPSDPATWPEYVKVGTTRISPRIEGAFQVVYDEGTPEETASAVFRDGRIACDASGIPFPMPEHVFRSVYRPAQWAKNDD